MLQVTDHFPIFAPELSPVPAGSTDFLTDSTSAAVKPEKKGTYSRDNSISGHIASAESDDLKDDSLAFRSYN